MTLAGLRPGEKLYEEKLMAEEGMDKTPNDLIHIGKPIEMDVQEFFKQLEVLAAYGNANSEKIRDIVAAIVPTYHSADSDLKLHICLFADDDMRYVDNYVEKIESAFDENPDADVIVFNLIEKNPTRYIIKKGHRVTWFNYLRYGTARIAIRLDKIKKNAIYFNQCFGGGTDYSHGEEV